MGLNTVPDPHLNDDPDMYDDLFKFFDQWHHSRVPMERLLRRVQMLTDKVNELEEQIKALKEEKADKGHRHPRRRYGNLNNMVIDK